MSASELRTSVRAGRLERIYRGSYLPTLTAEALQELTGFELTLARARALVHAVAARSPGLVVSHVSAALLHGLPLVAADLRSVNLIRNSDTGSRRGAGRIVRPAPLNDNEISVVDGLRVTSVARTLLDLACTADARTSIAAADAALHSRVVTPAQLEQTVQQAGPRTGIARARTRFAFAEGRAESPGESVLRWVLAQEGLPPPDLQVDVRAPSGAFLARVDCAYPQDAVLIEFDGKIKYSALLRPGETATDAVLAEKTREESLTECGFVVVRVSWDDLRDAANLASRIRSAQARGRRAVAAGLVTGHLAPPAPIRLAS